MQIYLGEFLFTLSFLISIYVALCIRIIKLDLQSIESVLKNKPYLKILDPHIKYCFCEVTEILQGMYRSFTVLLSDVEF